jgi:hypothetical protein
MRLSTSFAALLAFASLHTAPATACGWVEPTLHRITAHSVPGHGARSFVVLGAAPAVRESAWRLLAPMSYDGTAIATLQDEAPRKITLLGPTGATTVSSAHRVALDHSWELGKGAREAIEVQTSDYARPTIAIEGDARGAKWHQIVSRDGEFIADTELRVVPTEGGFIVTQNDRTIATGVGSVLGAFDLHGRRYVVEQRPGLDPHAIDVGAAS